MADRDHSLFEAELSGQVLNIKLLGRLLAWLKPYRGQILLSSALVLIASFLQVLMPIVLSLVVIDHLLMKNPSQLMPDLGLINLTEQLASALQVHPLMAACIIYGFLVAAWASFGHWHRMSLIAAVINALRDLRQDLFAHLETRPASFFDRVAVGRVMTRVTNDVETLYELLRGLGTLVGEFVPFFVAVAVMLAIDVKLTALLLLVLPVLAAATMVFRRFSRDIFRRVRNSVSLLNQNLQENLAGMAVVQLSVREDQNFQQYSQLNQDNRALELRSINMETFYGAFNDSMASIAVALILWYGGGEAIQDNISLGALVLFTRFTDLLIQPVVALGEQYNVLFRSMASGERIFQALDWDEQIHQPKQPISLPERLQGKLEFRGLNFAYDTNQPVLQDLSFNINPGEKLAIVGATGSGKSTIIRLLARFYNIADGQIWLDDIDLNQIHSQDLRRRIGVVLQDFHIFSGTVLDNIVLSNDNISKDQAIAAAKAVNAHPFITALAQGYETPLVERGGNLSHGQRQLLAFARVLAANPEILILDEATASIDTETEQLIQDALEKITHGRTSIIIAHRLQTIENADRIIVIEQGRVKEQGSHRELMALKGRYHGLYQLQFQSQLDG